MYLKIIKTKYFTVSSNVTCSFNFIDCKDNLSLKNYGIPIYIGFTSLLIDKTLYIPIS